MVILPDAGRNASTNDRTNQFGIPVLKDFIYELYHENVEFKSLEELEACLLPKMDSLHRNFMQEQMLHLEQTGVDISRYNLLKQVYRVNTLGNGIECELHPKCRFGVRI